MLFKSNKSKKEGFFMKSNSRSVENMLTKIAAIIYAPFLVIFLVLFAITSFLLCLVYSMLTKFYKDVKLPRIFDILLGNVNYSYYHQTEYA